MNIMIWFYFQIENLQEQLRDKDKQLTNLKDRVKSLQTDSSNTDTALATLEEALSEKVIFSCATALCAAPVGEVCPENVFLSWSGICNKTYEPCQESRWLCSGTMGKECFLTDELKQDSEVPMDVLLNEDEMISSEHGKIFALVEGW